MVVGEMWHLERECTMRKICFITGTRAEYGLLSRLMKMVQDDKDTLLQIVATNMHLSPKFGNTYLEIENDGFAIDYKVPIIDEDAPDTATTTVLSLSKALAGFAKAYETLRPDLIVILGDRYEMLAAASAALIFKIPVAHLHGGEITEGAYDDAIRHAITKMSHLHFTSTDEYRKRVIQMGEQPDRVFNVGSLGVENVKNLPLMGKEEIEKEIGFVINKNTILVTYHPVTLGVRTVKEDIENFMAALEERKDLRIIFTMPNSDTGAQIITDAISDFVARNSDRAVAYKSLGIKRYLSVMKYVGAVVGNSSSGLIEVPSFGIPTLNIGDRQRGRVAADSVCDCKSEKVSVLKGLEKVLSEQFRDLARQVHNPYEKNKTAEEIFRVVSSYPLELLKQKQFYDYK